MDKASKSKPVAKAKKRAASQTKNAAPESAPLTLAQARALAQVPARKAATRSALRGAVATASPGTVGAERRKLRVQQREEIRRRTRDYKATLSIMKKRGVKGLGPDAASGKRGRARSAEAAGGQPLQIFAEGDSWFDYPVPFFGGSIVPRLERLIGVPILNLAKAGDEARYMLGVDERKLLAKHLMDGCPAGGPWDAALFSGGGNDIVGNPMALWIKDFDPSIAPAEHLHAARFKAALALVAAAYEDLITLRNQLSPNTQLVFHAYDFALPDGRGICNLGPWLKPTFELRKFPLTDARFEVVKAMLKQFAAMLQSLHDPKKGVTFINAQGTLAPQTSSWHNELHPSRGGFDQFAAKFHARLKELFPGRVLV